MGILHEMFAYIVCCGVKQQNGFEENKFTEDLFYTQNKAKKKIRYSIFFSCYLRTKWKLTQKLILEVKPF